MKYVGYAPNPNNVYKNTIPYDLTSLQREVKYVESEHERMIPRVYQVSTSPAECTFTGPGGF